MTKSTKGGVISTHHSSILSHVSIEVFEIIREDEKENTQTHTPKKNGTHLFIAGVSFIVLDFKHGFMPTSNCIHRLILVTRWVDGWMNWNCECFSFLLLSLSPIFLPIFSHERNEWFHEFHLSNQIDLFCCWLS